MFPLLTRLGIAPEFQNLFRESVVIDTSEVLYFYYGAEYEMYGRDVHKLPVTGGLWIGGFVATSVARHVIISYSAMEAMAYLWLNRLRYQDLESVVLMAVGLRPCFKQVLAIKNLAGHAKFTLLFSKDFLGALADVYLAAGLRGLLVKFFMETNGRISISYRFDTFCFTAARFSLHRFERRCKTRFSVKTFKPLAEQSFLQCLVSGQSPQ